MERVIRARSKRYGKASNVVWYLCEWSPFRPGLKESPTWTRKQSEAKRFPYRSLARVDLARLKDEMNFPGDEEDLEIVRLVGTFSLARHLVAATRLADELRNRKGAPSFARAASEQVVIGTFEALASMVDAVEKKRAERVRAREERRNARG